MAILNSSGQEVVSYTYDEEGKLTAVNDGISGKTTTYYYDALDRLTLKEIRASGVLSLAVRYQYNEEDQLIGKTIFSDGQSPVHTAYAYDHLHNLSQITGEDVFQRISYSSHGLLEQTTTGYTSGGADHTVKQETYVYGTADTALHQHTVTYGGKTNTDTYTYDGRGNITQITRKVGSTEYIIKYTYDAANQLIREDNQQAGYSWAMTYDNAGNMTSRKKYSYTTGTLGAVLSTQTLTYGNATWGDVLTAINGTTVTSDASGNLLSDGTNTYTWKNGRQLAAMENDSERWDFSYDASGMRTQRSNGNTTYNYTYDDSTLIRMTVGSNALIFTYGINGHPITVNYNGTDYYYVTNIQGDVVSILNSSGTEVVTYTYDAWGNILSTNGSLASTLGKYNPFCYRGYVYDQETGLYYLQSRYYNPAICRFINADSVDILTATPMGLTDKNLFVYCDNNPVVRADNGGDFWHIVVGSAVGALMGGFFKVVSNAIEGNLLTDGLATAMLAGAASGALAATGVGIAGIIAGNAGISMAENAINQVVENSGFNNFDVGDMLIDGAIGGISGAIGGPGKGTKHLTNLGKQTVKRTLNSITNKGLKTGLKEAGKALAYYGKNSAKYYKSFLKGLPADFITTVGTTIASSNYMKYQYRCILGR